MRTKLTTCKRPRRCLQRLVGIRRVRSGDKILRGDGRFSEVRGVYPAAGTHFVQFTDGQGWHCPDNGRVFIANARPERPGAERTQVQTERAIPRPLQADS